MGRKKQMIKQLIDNSRNKTKELGEKQRQKYKELQKPINEEEHEKRVEMLKKLGILK